jgi:hypothetical protein
MERRLLRKLSQVAVLVVLGTLLLSQARAQDRAKLDALDEKIRRDFAETMPDWKHERVDPIVKTEKVLIQFWSFAHRKVKVSILFHESVEKSHEVFKNYERYNAKEVLSGLGEEAVASGYAAADVAFRIDKFTVYISTVADVDSDADAKSLSESERTTRERSEMVRLSREFARQVARVLDAP